MVEVLGTGPFHPKIQYFESARSTLYLATSGFAHNDNLVRFHSEITKLRLPGCSHQIDVFCTHCFIFYTYFSLLFFFSAILLRVHRKISDRPRQSKCWRSPVISRQPKLWHP